MTDWTRFETRAAAELAIAFDARHADARALEAWRRGVTRYLTGFLFVTGLVTFWACVK